MRSDHLDVPEGVKIVGSSHEQIENEYINRGGRTEAATAAMGHQPDSPTVARTASRGAAAVVMRGCRPAALSVQPGERQSQQRCVGASEATLGGSHNEVALACNVLIT